LRPCITCSPLGACVFNAWCKSEGGVAQNAWAADSDTGILDEYLIKLGLRWRVLRRLGMSYADELDEYERALAKALAHDGGAAILDLAPAGRLALSRPVERAREQFRGCWR
jgi:hypothetical protein